MSLSLVSDARIKIRVCRASGLPVQLAHIELFQEEYRQLYDKILKKFLGVNENKFIDAALSLRMSRLLGRLELRLHKKYPNTDTWEFIATPEGWTSKITEVGYPITVAQSVATKELTYVILDVNI